MGDVRAIRLVLVDDHAIVRDGLKALFGSVEDMAVVGEAASGEEALAVVPSADPDVVLMDIEMPGIGGIEAIRRLLSVRPESVVLVLTMYGEDEFVLAALRAGARGYLVKGAQGQDVLRVIRAVACGDVVFGQDVADQLLQAFRTTVPAAAPPPFPQLSEREREILSMVADGAPNPDIARRLGLTPKTVANHLSNILLKLPAVDRAEAIVRARRAGLGTP